MVTGWAALPGDSNPAAQQRKTVERKGIRALVCIGRASED
jgi:hypothetical protein